MTKAEEMSMFKPRRLLEVGLALALALTFGARSALADVFDLNLDHSSGVGVTVSPPYGTVTLTLVSSSEVTIVFQANTSQIIGFHDVGYNVTPGTSITNTMVTQVGATSNSFPLEGTNVQLDGLGTFTTVYGHHNAGPIPQSEATQVTIDIKGTNLTLADFENLSTGGTPSTPFAAGFARNVPGGTVVTGWVGSGPTPTQFQPSAPEPSTLAIAGLGAIGFIGYGLRRRKK
jgi:hypothetical protein